MAQLLNFFDQITNCNHIANRNHLNMKTIQTPKITVAVRKRPLNSKELTRNQSDIIGTDNYGRVIIREQKVKVDMTKYLEETTFNFDYAYNQHSDNEMIYEQSVRPLIENAFYKKAKITCFAYGQTGSGKSYTMRGDIAKGIPGIYYLGAQEIFSIMERQHKNKELQVTFYEIYCGKLFDLLNNRNELAIREDAKKNLNIIGANNQKICSASQFLQVVQDGSQRRVTAQNNANDESSRSHAILQISVMDGKKEYTKISFIDLAGNERGADHMDMGKQTKTDGAEINKSLLSLKECIRSLDQGKGHIPFRGSKLTMVLRDSFMGFCQTVMICNISPSSGSSQNTMNTLRYADRVKQMKNRDDNQKLSKDERRQREMMLPRNNNKQCIRVNIERGQDQEDIRNKINLAKGLQENHERQYQKMDIQEPKNQLFGQPQNQYGRRTENPKMFGTSDKRIGGGSQDIKGRGLSDIGGFRGRQIQTNDKQPLLSRNVPNRIGQNNMNMNNAPYSNDPPKLSKLFSHNQNLQSNRNHFQSMQSLKNQFQNCKYQNQRLLNEQMHLIKEQNILHEDYKNISQSCHYQEEIDNVQNYLEQLATINRKREGIQNQRSRLWDKLRCQTDEARHMTQKFRNQQNNQPKNNNVFSNGHQQGSYGQGIHGSRSQTMLQMHSSSNPIPFGGFNGQHAYGDQQLLQGLGEQARLF